MATTRTMYIGLSSDAEPVYPDASKLLCVITRVPSGDIPRVGDEIELFYDDNAATITEGHIDLYKVERVIFGFTGSIPVKAQAWVFDYEDAEPQVRVLVRFIKSVL